MISGEALSLRQSPTQTLETEFEHFPRSWSRRPLAHVPYRTLCSNNNKAKVPRCILRPLLNVALVMEKQIFRFSSFWLLSTIAPFLVFRQTSTKHIAGAVSQKCDTDIDWMINIAQRRRRRFGPSAPNSWYGTPIHRPSMTIDILFCAIVSSDQLCTTSKSYVRLSVHTHRSFGSRGGLPLSITLGAEACLASSQLHYTIFLLPLFTQGAEIGARCCWGDTNLAYHRHTWLIRHKCWGKTKDDQFSLRKRPSQKSRCRGSRAFLMDITGLSMTGDQ